MVRKIAQFAKADILILMVFVRNVIHHAKNVSIILRNVLIASQIYQNILKEINVLLVIICAKPVLDLRIMSARVVLQKMGIF